jgi:elongation factor Ts
MNNTEMIRELRELTQAGMKDCKESLIEAGWDLQKAVDIVKTKGLNVVSGREGKVAAEGLVSIANSDNATPVQMMVEVNCQTDFVANSAPFKQFVADVTTALHSSFMNDRPFNVDCVEDLRKELVASTKENIIVRRWWIEESGDASRVLVFPYLHSNKKIGVLLTLQAPSFEASKSKEFHELGNDLAMQIAAMNPVAVSVDRLSPVVVDRQKAIFTTQLVDLKKPQAAWGKILDGKLNKWYTDVCLLNQESVVVPKTTVQQVVKNVGAKLGGDIEVVSFIRCQVGEGIEKAVAINFVDEVSRMSGVHQHTAIGLPGSCPDCPKDL